MKFIPVSDCNETNWRIGVDELDWTAGKNSCGCSFNVLPARLLQMSYPDYLKYLRANGGEIHPRGCRPWWAFEQCRPGFDCHRYVGGEQSLLEEIKRRYEDDVQKRKSLYLPGLRLHETRKSF